MTLAIDRVTDKVIGQVLDPITKAMPETWALTILTRDGVKAISRASVRLEEVR